MRLGDFDRPIGGARSPKRDRVPRRATRGEEDRLKRLRKWLLRSVALLAIVVCTVAGVLAAVRFQEQGDARIRDARNEAEQLRARTGELDREVIELNARTDELRSQMSALQARFDEKEQAVVTLTARLDGSVRTEELAELQSRFDAMQDAYGTLLAQTSSLVPIRTPELPGDALYLDRSVADVTYTGAVCSGSMEPNITCDDLLILYRASVTDLDVGDIIYFRRPNADCSGHTDRFMLHRIRRVVAAPTGLSFETRGDAFSSSDACLVPSGDVLYKLLTTVRGARISSQSS